jgi:guanylate cyclase
MSKQIYTWVARIGADPNDSDELRLQKTLMVTGAFMFIAAGLLWGLIYILFGQVLAGMVPITYTAVSLLSIAIFGLTRRFHFFRFSQLLLTLLLPALVMMTLGGFINGSAVILWSFVSPLGAILFDEPHRAPRWCLAYIAVVIASILIQPYVPLTVSLPPFLVLAFFVMNIVAVPTVTFALLYYFVGQRNILQEKSENLLLNILPKEIVAILKNESRTIADYYAGASILFADMVNFTTMSAEMSPVEMVDLLNEIFSHFDTLVEKYGLEKIKTVGDCYMVAAGVPRPRPDHAQVLTLLALDMRAYIRSQTFKASRPVDFRIGLNSGPVLAGVIGRKKFIYDLWGDAVNTASRMESHGAGGVIQITRATYELIKDDFVCESHGTISVKGKGEMEVWFVVGQRSSSV